MQNQSHDIHRLMFSFLNSKDQAALHLTSKIFRSDLKAVEGPALKQQLSILTRQVRLDKKRKAHFKEERGEANRKIQRLEHEHGGQIEELQQEHHDEVFRVKQVFAKEADRHEAIVNRLEGKIHDQQVELVKLRALNLQRVKRVESVLA